MIAAFFAPLSTRLFGGIALALAVMLGLQTWRLDAAYQTIANTKAAQHQATVDQVAANHEPARTSAEIARQSDAQAPDYYRSVSVAADARRVRSPACSVSTPDLSGADRAAAIDDRSASAADVVSRPRAEDDQIVAAAARAAQMHQDAEDLIAAGVAVAADK
jgi:hypothetical protein